MPQSAIDQHRTRVIVSALLFVLAAGSLVSLMLAFAAPGNRHLLIVLMRAPSRFFVRLRVEMVLVDCLKDFLLIHYAVTQHIGQNFVA